MWSSMKPYTFFNSSDTLLRSGLIVSSPAGRMPSFGFSGAGAVAGCCADPREQPVDTIAAHAASRIHRVIGTRVTIRILGDAHFRRPADSCTLRRCSGDGRVREYLLFQL
jgi:hypothetical protein